MVKHTQTVRRQQSGSRGEWQSDIVRQLQNL